MSNHPSIHPSIHVTTAPGRGRRPLLGAAPRPPDAAAADADDDDDNDVAARHCRCFQHQHQTRDQDQGCPKSTEPNRTSMRLHTPAERKGALRGERALS